MTAVNETTIRQALQAVIDPNTGQDFVTGKCIRGLSVSGPDVQLEVELGYPAQTQFVALAALLRQAVQAVPGVGAVDVQVRSRVTKHAVQRGVEWLIPDFVNHGPGRVGGWWPPVYAGLVLVAALGLHLPAALIQTLLREHGAVRIDG